MKKEDIHLDDIQRILQGAIPLEFYVELIIRAVAVYFLIAFGMKYMGKRISAELTRSELAAIASIAAATGLVIMAPDRGLLPPLIVLGVMIFIKRWVDNRNYKSEKFERAVEGHYGILIENGVLQVHEMKETRMSREQVFAQLRGAGITHLGEVKRLYMEANGSFSIVNDTEKKPGLPIIPKWDEDFLNGLARANDVIVCSQCGNKKQQEKEPCSNCGVLPAEHAVN